MENRKNIEELIALYSLEPSLKDIYVEGHTDKELIEWVLTANNIQGVNVYVIDIINVDVNTLNRYELDTGSNRSRILALSEELSTSLPETCKVVCVADRDFEDYVPSGINNCFLEFTDYNSAELYLFNSSSLYKFIRLVLGGFSISAEDIIKNGTPILEELYIIRLANHALKWRMNWIDFNKYIQFSNSVHFDRDAFVKAYLLKNKKWTKRQEFNNKVKALRLEVKEDPRYRIRGHDLIEFLYYAVKKLRKNRKFGDVWTFQGAFTGCLELDWLTNNYLFQRLISL